MLVSYTLCNDVINMFSTFTHESLTSFQEWLLVQKDPNNEAIEEQDGDGVRNIIENTEAVAVFICKLISHLQKLLKVLG